MARYVTRLVIFSALALAGCTINVNVYDHRAIGRQTPPAASPQPSAAAKRYAELYFATTPSLAKVRLISDGSNAIVDRELGETPLTIRLAPEVGEPFNSSVCGKTIIVLFELDGYKTAKAAQKISCFSTEGGSEANTNEIRSTLLKIP